MAVQCHCKTRRNSGNVQCHSITTECTKRIVIRNIQTALIAYKETKNKDSRYYGEILDTPLLAYEHHEIEVAK